MTAKMRLLCPIDFSEASEHALTYAINFAKRVDAEIEVLTVYEVPFLSMPDGAIVATADLVASLSTIANKRLAEAVAKHASDGVKLKQRVAEGVPYEEIVRIAEADGFDAIVMGTHGRKGLSHLWMGSVAERVVRMSPVPVLTVRLPAKS